ncbi:unnamed protein product [Calypogeia fissa]
MQSSASSFVPQPLSSAVSSYNYHISCCSRLFFIPTPSPAADGLHLHSQGSVRNACGRLCFVHRLTNSGKQKRWTIAAKSCGAHHLFSSRATWKRQGLLLRASEGLYRSRTKVPQRSESGENLLTISVGNRGSHFTQTLGTKLDTSSQRIYAEPPTPEGRIFAMSGDDAPKVEEDTASSVFLAGLMPKKEIGADRFLAQHPSYDGRGVTIAIFDSGVDPAATGLQITPDGKPKILDVLDCTGSGDVDTSAIATADDEGFIIGASGARLQINKAWKNPSGEWRVGLKLVYELFTDTLASRVKKERKKKWTEAHREETTLALRGLTAFDLKNPKLSEASLKKEREDLQTRCDLLLKLSESYDDKGPVIDAVVWHDGEVWRVALDTQDLEGDTGSGKLADFSPLTNYRIERKYGTFSRLDACTFVTNVYDNGNVLSLVTDSSPHGTHVAGITAAYHPEEPLLNGVAPGAQLVSCKIGDSRLGSMETCTGLTRALIAVIENKCDLINMSYGEPTSIPNFGRFIDLATEVVNKHGVIFISSAGNNGPSLSTVTAPGGTSSCIVGIGAYVSPAMASASHSIVQPPTQGLQYTWSSRGPTPDGDLGVTLSAPGGAIAPVPKWTLQGRMLMNGTSMASPCACGGVALVLSSLKAEGQVISPHVVRKALENTAAKVGEGPFEPLTTGRGLLQVDLAYEYLQKCKERPSILYKVELKRNGGPDAAVRGVYLRDVRDSRQASEWNVTVKPEFHEDADNMDLLVPFEERLQLHSSNPTWLKCPEYLLLTNNGRSFKVVVDPTQLKEGAHYAEVVGTDMEAPWRGPSFRVPVTVIKPMELQAGSALATFDDLSFTPGHIERRFVVVPEGATWAELSVRVSGFDTPRQFSITAVQLSSKKRPSTWATYAVFSSPSSKNFSFPIEGGLTMELTLALFWSSGSGSDVPASAQLQIEFHGIQATEKDVFINGNETVTRVDVKAPLTTERFSPSATLSKVRVPYRPVEVKLEPLSAERDKLPNGRQIHALTLTYKFSLAEGAEVTPRLSYLNTRIYDAEFESQFYMISDANKRVLATGDCYPKAVRISKGDYVLRLFIRHDNMSYLEKLKKTPLLLDRKLEEKNQIRLSFYSQIDGPITGADQLKSKLLAPGEIQPVYFGAAPDDKLPKDPVVGTVLVGKLKWGKLSWGSSKSDQNGLECPTWSRLSYVVPPPTKAEEKPKEKAPEEKKSVSVRLEEEVRDAKIKLLTSMPKTTKEECKEWDDLAFSLQTDYPKHLPLKVEILQKLAASQVKDDDKAKIIQAADDVISLIDKDALAKYFGVKSETDDPHAVQLKKDMETQRDMLADALYKKGLALSEREEQTPVPEDEKPTPALRHTEPPGKADGLKHASEGEGVDLAKEPESDRSSGGGGAIAATLSVKQESNGAINAEKDEFEETYLELRKWVDVGSLKYILLTVKREMRAGRNGSAIKALNELIQDESKPPQKHLFELRIKLIERAGWTHWASYERKWLLVRFPSAYPLF